MEPFELTLQQVTFEEGDFSPQSDLDSFDTVVNYDTQFEPPRRGTTLQGSSALTYTYSEANKCRGETKGLGSHAAYETLQKSFVPLGSFVSKPCLIKPDQIYREQLVDIPSCNHSNSSHVYTESRNRTNKTTWLSTNVSNQTSRPSIRAQPSCVKTTQIHTKLVCSDGVSAGLLHQHNIIHPDYSLRDIDTSYITRKEKISETDIRTLFKVSANTAALNKARTFQKLRMSNSHQSPGPGDVTDGAFETVADALHLQNSVIGDRKIAPAPPEVVAQIIAETERRLKGLSPSVTPTQGTDQFLTPTSGLGFDDVQIAVNTNDNASASSDFTATNELIRVPTQSITMTTEKTSWRGSAITKEDKKDKNKLDIDPLSDQGSASEDTQSVSSAASELEAINQSETDRFLKSLPPYKTININDIVPKEHVQRTYSPPVKETSFRPVKQISQDLKTSFHDTSDDLYSNQLTDSGIGSEVVQENNSVTMVTSTPKRFSNIHVPQVGPLFNKNLREHVVTKNAHQSPDKTVRSEELEAILREKAKLEGQLEMLTEEAQTTLQERAELQAQVSSLKIKLKSVDENSKKGEVDTLKLELDKFKSSRSILEQSLASAQKFLDEKVMESKGLQEELHLSQESNDKMQSKVREIRDDIRAKEVTIQALKNKIAELYVEVQSVLQTKMETESEMRSARSDLNSLLNTKVWYQQQLQAAHEARSKLQHELTMLQGQAASQGSIIERLKTENAKLRHQMKESQQKALKDKETLAKHLEAIESDMMEREAAFQDIQRERTMIENTFDAKLQSVDDEKSRIQNLISSNNDLDSRLEKAQADLKKKQNQIFNLENEQIEMMKKLTLSQESLIERDTIVEESKQKLIEVEAQLSSFQKSLSLKDSEILQLKEEKAATEIALKAALEEKSSVDKALENLRSDMGKVEKSFRSMKQDLTNKTSELNQVHSEKNALLVQVEESSKCVQVEKQKAEVSMTENKSHMFDELQNQKSQFVERIGELENSISNLQNVKDENIKEKENLKKELSETRERLTQTETELTSLKQEIDELKSSGDKIYNEEIVNENEQLKNSFENLEKQHQKETNHQQQKSEQLETDLKSLQTELTDRQAVFDTNVELLSSKLREVTQEKDKLETELDMAKKKYDISMLEQQDQVTSELQKLARELETAKLEKQKLENQLFEIQRIKAKEIEEFQLHLTALEDQLQLERQEHLEAMASQETNQKLELELEKEKGRVAGLMQTNSSLKQHVSQLEEALARRESSLVDVQTHMEGLVRQWQDGEEDYNKRILSLEGVLQQEKDGQRDLRKQIGLKITENKKLKRRHDTSKVEKETLQHDLDVATQEKGQLQTVLDQWKQSHISEQSRLTDLDSENKVLTRELERVKRELTDNLAREPVLQEQIQSLQWQLSQKCKEIDAIQEHISLAEQRQNVEIDDLKKSLQESQSETEAMRAELATAKQEKANYHSQVTELRTTLKASVQHHKLTKRMNSGGSRNNSEDTKDVGTQVVDHDVLIPPLPFDLDMVEKLIQDTGVKALESKPLDNLQTCLSCLRSQMSG
ncbi:golgin subfamily A member 3-like isoform X2 [Mytilus edulis]|uniref:golgin subfamily A member 3-like isoform X2 n=1 Tax=Mytilus edulis TaxID=6550 RepID=UPI0039EF74B0